jgi:hypothetical protein
MHVPGSMPKSCPSDVIDALHLNNQQLQHTLINPAFPPWEVLLQKPQAPPVQLLANTLLAHRPAMSQLELPRLPHRGRHHLLLDLR